MNRSSFEKRGDELFSRLSGAVVLFTSSRGSLSSSEMLSIRLSGAVVLFTSSRGSLSLSEMLLSIRSST